MTLSIVAMAVAPAFPAYAQSTGSSVDGYSEPGGSIISEVEPVTPGARGAGPDRGEIDAGPGDRAQGGPSDQDASRSGVLPGRAGGSPAAGADPATGVGSAGGGELGTGGRAPAPPDGAVLGEGESGDGGSDDDGQSGGGRGQGSDDEDGPEGFGDGRRRASVGGGAQAGPGEVSPGSLGFGIGARDVALVLVASCMLLLIGVGLGSLARLERTL